MITLVHLKPDAGKYYIEVDVPNLLPKHSYNYNVYHRTARINYVITHVSCNPLVLNHVASQHQLSKSARLVYTKCTHSYYIMYKFFKVEAAKVMYVYYTNKNVA